MDFGALHQLLINMWSNNKELTNIESIKEFINDSNSFLNLYAYIDGLIGSEQLTPSDIKKIKDHMTSMGKIYNVDFSEIKFDKSFAKPDKKRFTEHAIYKDMAIKNCVKEAFYDRALTVMLPKAERELYPIISSMVQNINELPEIIDIFKDNTNVENPKYGLTPSQIKEKLLIRQLNRVQSMCEYLSKDRSEEEVMEYLMENQSVLQMAQEVDANKLDHFIERCHIERTPELEAKLKDFEKYKELATSTSKYTVIENLKANPLYKYANVKDLIDFDHMRNKVIEDQETATETVLINKLKDGGILDKLEKTIDGTVTNQINSIAKVAQNIPTPQVQKDANGVIMNKFEVGTMECIMKLRAEQERTDFAKLQFFNSKHEQITFDQEEKKYADLYAKIFDLACKGETITIKDQNGKFIDYYETSMDAHGFNKSGAELNDVCIDKLCGEFEKNIKAKILMGDKEYTLAQAQLDLDEKIRDTYDKAIVDLDKDISLLNRTDKKGNPLDPDLNDIDEMLNNLHGNIKKIDNIQICVELKTIKTFCQAYLDANCDSKDKDMIKKCKAVTNIYKSFQGIEADMKRIQSCEDNLKLDMQLAGRMIDEKELDEYNKVVANSLNSTIQKKQAFDIDPTITIINDKKSEFIEKDDPNKKLEKQMNDLNK